MTTRIDEVVTLAFRYGGIDGAHHKMWVIDQMLRILLGDSYEAEVVEANTKDGDPNAYEWDTGIAP